MNTQVGAFKTAGSFQTFAKSPEDFYNINVNGNGWEHFAKNHIAFDLGFDNKLENNEKINSIVEKMEQDYDLVLIR